MPVNGHELPSLRLQQTEDAGGLSLKIELETETVELMIPNSSSEVRIKAAKSTGLKSEVTYV
jgi:hypothetical protein